jgi:methionine--tRNA ligase beta chain
VVDIFKILKGAVFMTENTELKPKASYEDFKKLEIKIAEIESAVAHPNADKLYVLGLKVGEKKKTIVAGIKKHYGPDELIGKKIVIIDNLEPAVIRGVESQGMLLAASSGEDLTLVTPERQISDGAVVK